MLAFSKQQPAGSGMTISNTLTIDVFQCVHVYSKQCCHLANDGDSHSFVTTHFVHHTRVHADDSRGVRFSPASVCLFVCLFFCTISQKPLQLGSSNLIGFDTVDHRLLLDRLRLELGVAETPLNLKAETNLSRWPSTNHTLPESTWVSHNGLCLARCCSRSTAARSVPATAMRPFATLFSTLINYYYYYY